MNDKEKYLIEDLYKAWLNCSVLHPDESPLYREIVKFLCCEIENKQ